MPHYPGHVQNSFLRKKAKRPFTKKVGVLFPLEDEKDIDHLDYPVIFFDRRNTRLEYGKLIAFHFCLLELGGKLVKSGGKYFCYATDVVDFSKHKAAEDAAASYLKTLPPRTGSTDPNKEAIERCPAPLRKAAVVHCKDKSLKRILDQDITYISSLSYEKIYLDEKGKRRSEKEILKWIVENTICFDDMNLATN